MGGWVYFCRKALILELISEAVNQYAERYSSPENTLLEQLASETRGVHAQAHMMSGHLQGRLLAMISKLVRPAYILEIGTFTGYSALCLAEGLQENGQLHTIELRAEEAAIATKYFKTSAYADQIFLHEGEAGTIIPTLDRQWDLVFIDADKTGYIEYYEQVLPLLRRGGLIIVDNVLFHGQVLETPVTGKSARAVQAFNDHVKNDDRTEKVMLTLRDGLLMMLKK